MTVFSHDMKYLSDTNLRQRINDLEDACERNLKLAESAAKDCDAVGVARALRLAEGALDRHLVSMNALAKRMKGGKDSPFVKQHRALQDGHAQRLEFDVRTFAGFVDMCECRIVRQKPQMRYKY